MNAIFAKARGQPHFLWHIVDFASARLEVSVTKHRACNAALGVFKQTRPLSVSQLKTNLMVRYKSLVVALALCQAAIGGILFAVPDLLVLRLDFHADQVAEIERKVGGAVLLVSLFTFIILKIEAARHKRWTHLAIGLLWLGFVLVSLLEVRFGYVELSPLFWFLCAAVGLSHLLLALSVRD